MAAEDRGQHGVLCLRPEHMMWSGILKAVLFLFLLSLQEGEVRGETQGTLITRAVLPSAAWLRASIPALRGGGAGEEDVDLEVEARDKALIQELQAMRNEAAALAQRRSMLEQEVEDHYLVTDTLQEFEGSRRCYRSVGGVLMESTVGDVCPAVRKELEMLSKALNELTAKIAECHKKMTKFQDKHAIRIVRGEPVN
mmetsp:Transcript_1658/g.3755  ORF Transcript_1658/g.3755 Transcript_1658/m.3755 type:complete len:197 (+) Transcript_1658:196-786(+)